MNAIHTDTEEEHVSVRPDPRERSAMLLENQRTHTQHTRRACVDAFLPGLVPDPLQTPAYSRRVLERCGLIGDDLDRAVQIRQDLAQHLRAQVHLPHRYVVTELALTAPEWMPAPDHQEQMEHLYGQVRDLEHVRVRVLPTPSPVPWSLGFELLTGTGGRETVAHLETPDGGLTLGWCAAGFQTKFEDLFNAATDLHELAFSAPHARTLIHPRQVDQ